MVCFRIPFPFPTLRVVRLGPAADPETGAEGRGRGEGGGGRNREGKRQFMSDCLRGPTSVVGHEISQTCLGSGQFVHRQTRTGGVWIMRRVNRGSSWEPLTSSAGAEVNFLLISSIFVCLHNSGIPKLQYLQPPSPSSCDDGSGKHARLVHAAPMTCNKARLRNEQGQSLPLLSSRICSESHRQVPC